MAEPATAPEALTQPSAQSTSHTTELSSVPSVSAQSAPTTQQSGSFHSSSILQSQSNNDNDEASLSLQPARIHVAPSSTSFSSSSASTTSIISSTSSSLSSSEAAHQQEKKAEEDKKPEENIDWEFWAQVLNDFDTIERTQTKELRKKIKKGIPKTVRGRAWQLLCRGRSPELEEKYGVLLKKQSPHEKTIIRDLARTFPDNEFFKSERGDGQTSLFNVVKAYSMHDPSVGYCQGLAFIAGALLLNMPDEQAFCTLISLMESYGMHDLFIPSMEGLQLCLYQFDHLLELMLPRIHAHLEAEGVKSSMYASQWFMTLFLYRFPLDFVFRLWDILFLDGLDAIFRFSIALLVKNEEAILGMDFEKLLDFLKNGLPEAYHGNADDLIQDGAKVQIRQRYMMRLEKEFLKMRSTTTKELTELEALKRAQEDLNAKNTKLADKVAALSKENCRLTRDINSSKEATTKSGDATEALQQQVKELQQIINANDTHVTAASPSKSASGKPRKTKKVGSAPQKWAKDDRETEQEVADILRALVEENASLRSMLEAQSHGISAHLPPSVLNDSHKSSAPSLPTSTSLANTPADDGKSAARTAIESRNSANEAKASSTLVLTDGSKESEEMSMEQQLIAFKLKYAQAEEARLEMSIRLEAMQRYVDSLQEEGAEKKHTLPNLQEKGKNLLSRIRKPGFLPGSS